MKVFKNLEESSYTESEQSKIKQILIDLIPLRKNKEQTHTYCDQHLRGENWLLDVPFKDLRWKTFKILKDDKKSFGYMYWWLATEYNQEASCVLYPCVFKDEEIAYCIDFDLDEVEQEMELANSYSERLEILGKYYMESKKNRYEGEEKTRFENLIKEQIQMTKLIEDNKNGLTISKTSDINSNRTTSVLQTERAKKYFDKALKMGFIEQTETGYKNRFKTKALLAYFLELVFCRDDEGKNNGTKFPETALNDLFKEKRLGQARSQIANNHNGHGKPEGFEDVEKIFT